MPAAVAVIGGQGGGEEPPVFRHGVAPRRCQRLLEGPCAVGQPRQRDKALREIGIEQGADGAAQQILAKHGAGALREAGDGLGRGTQADPLALVMDAAALVVVDAQQGVEYRAADRPAGHAADGEEAVAETRLLLLNARQQEGGPIGGANPAAFRRHDDDGRRGQSGGRAGGRFRPLLECLAERSVLGRGAAKRTNPVIVRQRADEDDVDRQQHQHRQPRPFAEVDRGGADRDPTCRRQEDEVERTELPAGIGRVEAHENEERRRQGKVQGDKGPGKRRNPAQARAAPRRSWRRIPMPARLGAAVRVGGLFAWDVEAAPARQPIHLSQEPPPTPEKDIAERAADRDRCRRQGPRSCASQSDRHGGEGREPERSRHEGDEIRDARLARGSVRPPATPTGLASSARASSTSCI